MGASLIVRAVDHGAAKALQVHFALAYFMGYLEAIDIHRQPAGLAYSTVPAVDGKTLFVQG